jgi:hypothetical protein
VLADVPSFILISPPFIIGYRWPIKATSGYPLPFSLNPGPSAFDLFLRKSLTTFY